VKWTGTQAMHADSRFETPAGCSIYCSRTFGTLFWNDIKWSACTQFSGIVFSLKKNKLVIRIYRVYQKNRNLRISQEIDIVLKTKDFRRLGI
jgi:hypothetical protein